MASTICTLMNLSCYFIMSETWAWDKDKNIWITSFYIPGKESYDADTESRKKNKLNWNGCLTKTFLQKLFPSFSLNQGWTYLHQGSLLNYQSHTILTQRPCILMLFQYHGVINPCMHFLPLL